MKKTFTLSLLVLLISARAQERRYFVYDWRADILQYDPVKHDVPQGVKEVKYAVIRGKKDTVFTVRQYNEQGKMTKLYPLNDPKNKRTTAEIVYDKNREVSQVKFLRKNQTRWEYRYTRTDKGKPLSQEKIKGRKLMYKYEWSYNADGNVAETKNYGKKGKYRGKSVTEYYDQHNKSKTTLYTAKGKVKKVWTYECKEEGELQTNRKNEIRVCLRKDIANNILTEVYQSFDSKGQAVKNIYKYHLPDSSIMEYTRYDKNDQMVQKYVYAGSFEKTLEFTIFKKGKNLWGRKYEYENGLMMSDTYLEKGKAMGKGVYTYNEKGFMTGTHWINKKGKVSSAVLIEYVM